MYIATTSRYKIVYERGAFYSTRFSTVSVIVFHGSFLPRTIAKSDGKIVRPIFVRINIGTFTTRKLAIELFDEIFNKN